MAEEEPQAVEGDDDDDATYMRLLRKYGGPVTWESPGHALLAIFAGLIDPSPAKVQDFSPAASDSLPE
jgi:hypothetical protein